MLALKLKHPRQSNNSVHDKEANKFFTDLRGFHVMYGFASTRCLLKLNKNFKFPLRTYFSYNNKPKQQR